MKYQMPEPKQTFETGYGQTVVFKMEVYTKQQMQAAYEAGRLAGLEAVAALATVGATYPELMEFLQSELKETP